MSQIRQCSEVNTVSYQNSSEGEATKKIHWYPEEHSKGLKCKVSILNAKKNSILNACWVVFTWSLLASGIRNLATYKKSLQRIHDRLNTKQQQQQQLQQQQQQKENADLKAQENVGSNTQQQQQQQQQQPESPGKCGPHQPSPALSSPPCQLLPPLTSCTMCPFLRNILKSGNHTLTQSIYNQNTIMLWVGLGRVTAMVEVQSLEWVSNYCNAIWDLEVALSEAFSGMGINIMYLRLLLFQEHCSSGAKSVLKFDNQG